MVQTLEQTLQSCTVKVQGAKQGTGFFVGPGLIITALHLFKNTPNSLPSYEGVKVHFGGDIFPVIDLQRIEQDEFVDLAILRIEKGENPCVFLHGEVKLNDSLYAYGFPKDFPEPSTFHYEGWAGKLNSLMKLKLGQVSPGLSGAPLLNLRTGGVCGLVTHTRDSLSNLGGYGIGTPRIFTFFPYLKKIQEEYHRANKFWFECVDGNNKILFGVKEYLEVSSRKWLSQGYSFLKPKKRVEFSQYYAPITLRKMNENGSPPSDPVVLGEVMKECKKTGKHLLIVGDAGAGKSGAIRFLAEHSWLSPGYIGIAEKHVPLLLKANALACASMGGIENRLQEALINTVTSISTYQDQVGIAELLISGDSHKRLFLIDGYEEVESEDNRLLLDENIQLLMNWCDAEDSVVITVRPSHLSYFNGVENLASYYVQPLNSEGIFLVVNGWLDNARVSFMSAAMGISPLCSSPLILSIALKIFETEEGTLPLKLVDLYTSLIVKCYQEIESRVRNSGYSERIRGHLPEIMSFLAFRSLDEQMELNAGSVRSFVAEYLENSMGRMQITAKEEAEQFLRICEQAGILLFREGRNFVWLHPTIRDYFAAQGLLAQIRKGKEDVKEVISLGCKYRWKITITFVLQLLLEGNEIHSGWLKTILVSKNYGALDFVTGLIHAGTPFSESDLRMVIKHLVDGVRREGPISCAALFGGAQIIDLLYGLLIHKRAQESLRIVLEDRKLPKELRIRIREVLERRISGSDL